jgi:hypothetical protein
VAADRARTTVVSYALDARGRPAELVVHTVVRDAGGAALRAGGGRASARGGAGAARVTELDATLDLRDARNRVAASAFVRALRDPLDVRRLQEGALALGDRIARAGVLDRRTYALSSGGLELSAALALGARLGGGFASTHEGMRLLSAETRLPGLPFLPRDDCRAS